MWIKICGITDTKTAVAIADLGADAIGLNFYAPSPRCVSVEAAADIVAAVNGRVQPVGVFVNHSIAEIRRICETCQIGTVQLHGDEGPDVAADLLGLQIIRAFRVGSDGLDAVAAELEAYERLGVPLMAGLVDARVDGSYGGTGLTAPWDLVARDWLPVWPPLILAGGLNSRNVADGIAAVRPWGVDVAGGVESAPGVKDLGLVREFVDAARGAS